MNPETLERIMIDDALGTLEPDMKELLKAYTANSEAARQQAKSIRETVGAARNVLNEGKTDAPFPPLFSELMKPTPWPKARSHFFQTAVAIAASLIVGVGVGWYMRTARHVDVSASVPEKILKAVQAKHPITWVRHKDRRPSFWSTKRMYSQYTHQREESL